MLQAAGTRPGPIHLVSPLGVGAALLPVVIAALSLASSSLAADAPAPASPWTYSSPDTIRWWFATPAGSLVVATRNDISGVAPETGAMLWKLAGVENSRPGDFQVLGRTSLAIVSLRGQVASHQLQVFLMDLGDGRIRWSADSLGVTESFGAFLLPGGDQILLAAVMAPGGARRALLLIDVATGALRWKSQSLYGNDPPPPVDVGGRPTVAHHQPPLVDSDSTFILFMGKRTMRKVDRRSGVVLWEARVDSSRGLTDLLFETKDSPALIHGFARMRIASDGQHFYAPFQNSIGRYSLADGQSVWTRSPRLAGVVTQFEEVPGGILATVKDANDPPQHNLVRIDLESGKSLWKAPRGMAKSFWFHHSNFLVDGSRALIAADGNLFEVNMETGKLNRLIALEFPSSDQPRELESRSEGYLVSGTQSLLLASREGKPVHRFFRHAPGGSGLKATLGTLLGVGLIVATEAGNRVWVERDDYLDMMDRALSFADEHGSATHRSDDFWVLASKTGADEQPGLVRVNKATGEVHGEVPLGKQPGDYQIGSEGRVFVRSNDVTIRCHAAARR